MDFAQVRLPVTDFEATFRFYRDVLGLVAQPDDPKGVYAKFSFGSGKTAIAIQVRAHMEGVVGKLSEASAAVFALRVDDLDATFRVLQRRGAVFVGEPHDAYGRMRVAHLRDPEGNLVELQQWNAA